MAVVLYAPSLAISAGELNDNCTSQPLFKIASSEAAFIAITSAVLKQWNKNNLNYYSLSKFVCFFLFSYFVQMCFGAVISNGDYAHILGSM